MPHDWKEYRREYYQRNKDLMTEQSKAWKAANKVRHKYLVRRSKYMAMGIDIDSIPKQTDFCEACGKICTTYLDHCHTKKVFRGWLCLNCNTALGHAKDDVEILRKLIQYLEEK